MFWRRQAGEISVILRGKYSYHKFPAHRLARFHHYHRQIALNPKKRKVKTGLGDMPTEELRSRIGLWSGSMMVERELAVYGLVSQRRS